MVVQRWSFKSPILKSVIVVMGLDDKKKPTAEQLEKYRSVRDYNNDWRFELNYDLYTKIFTENGKVGVTDVLGEVLVLPIYDQIMYVLHDSYRHSLVPAVRDGKIALVWQDGKGTPETEFEYDDAYHFDRCYYVVEKDSKKDLIRIDGQIILSQCEEIHGPYDFFVPFKENGKYGFLILEYDDYIQPEYEDFEVDDDDYLCVLKDGEWGYVDFGCEFTTDRKMARKVTGNV